MTPHGATRACRCPRPRPAPGGWLVPPDLGGPRDRRALRGRARPTATCILFALATGESSAWHRLTSEEVWLAHTGTVDLVLGGTGPTPAEGDALTLGPDLAAGHHPQLLVPAGVWQRTRPVTADALVSCVVSPGFDFEDFEQL